MRSVPTGENIRRTPWYRQAKHNEARRDGVRESERSIVPLKPGNCPLGTRWRKGGAAVWTQCGETEGAHRGSVTRSSQLHWIGAEVVGGPSGSTAAQRTHA